MKYLVVLILCLKMNAQHNKEIYQFSKDILNGIENDTLPWKYQIGATSYSFGQYYLKALKAWDLNGAGVQRMSKEDSLYFKTFKPQRAKEYILERSKSERLIIINEAHHNSMHRVFTTSLLQELYDNGYRFFGLEAISDTLINKRKFVTTESGYYTNEPQMSNLINEAIKIGYTIFNYEASNGKNGKEREIEQAINIANIINKNPNSKFLIHCGWEHVIEGTPVNENWEKAMAGRLKDFAKIDPFTIDQTHYSEKGDSKYNSPYINFLNVDYSVIMTNEKGMLFNGEIENNQTDCRIIHPVTKYIDARPNWLFMSGERKKYRLPKDKIPQFPILVLAYKIGVFEQKGTPFDVVEILDENTIGNLILEKGKYKIILKDKNYNIISEYEQIIK